MAKTSLNLEENIEGLLCYVLTWITGLVFILLEKENKFVRFHAMQSIVTFLPLNVLMMLLMFIPIFGWAAYYVLSILTLILWIVLMVKAYQGEMFKLPIAGSIAEKQLK